MEGVTGSIPVASTILIQSPVFVEKHRLPGLNRKPCSTTVCHTATSQPPKNRRLIRARPEASCSTKLRHQPSPRSHQPSSRSARSRPRPPGLILRGRVYSLRLRVPRSLADQIGKTHFMKSLSTGSMAQAFRSARLVAADFETMLLVMGGQDCASTAPQPEMLRSPTARVALPAGRSFADLFALFQADPSRQRAVKTDMIYDNLFEVVSGVWGADTPLRSLDREACRELLEVLRWLPSNTLKRFPVCRSSRRREWRGRRGSVARSAQLQSTATWQS